MTYYRRKRDPRREQFIQLFSRVIEQLQSSYDEKKINEKLTMDLLAKNLGVSKSRVSKVLSGKSNLTLETLSDIAYELGRDVSITFSFLEQNFPTNDIPSTNFLAQNSLGFGAFWHVNIDDGKSKHLVSSTNTASENKNIPLNAIVWNEECRTLN